jgi:tetratricopeptide (TPR) repeat protein
MRQCVQGLLLVLTVMLVLPHSLTAMLVNGGNLLVMDALLESRSPVGEYPHWLVKSHPDQVQLAVQLLQTAALFAPHSATAQWGYGRSALAVGLADKAVEALPLNGPCLRNNPLCLLDTLMAQSRAGNDDGVLALDANPLKRSIAGTVMSDTVALAYMNQARTQLAEGDIEGAQSVLRQAVTFRPFDLYANYQLWDRAIRFGNIQEAATYRRQIIFSPVEAVTVGDERLLDYVFETLPRLIQPDFWGYERGQHLIGYWIWRYPEDQSLKQLIQTLTLLYPQDAKWHYYSGELYQRLGQADLARQEYRQAVKLAPSYRLAQERLEQLSSLPSVRPNSDMQDVQIVAQLMGKPVEAVRLGTNLTQWDPTIPANRNFVQGWEFAIAGVTRNKQPYVAGADLLEGTGSQRILNLWWPAADASLGYSPYAEYKGSVIAMPTRWLALSFWYKARGMPGNNGLAVLGADTPDWQPIISYTPLPVTADDWVKVIVVAPVPQSHSSMFPVLRNESAADIWFANVAVRPLEFATTPIACLESPCVFFGKP